MKLSILGATATIVALAITGCSQQTTETLSSSKSPTQLLRNEAATRLIDGTDESVAEQQDYSASCKSETEDPTGLYRSWRSTLLASVPADSAIGVDQFVGALATSFAEDGWVLKEEHGGDGSEKISTMTSTTSVATLKFTSTEGASGEAASVYIEASGPCVLTEGPESDEVKRLEK